MQVPPAKSEDLYCGSTEEKSFSCALSANTYAEPANDPLEASKTLVADQVTILLLLRSKPLLRQLPVYSKSGATGVQALLMVGVSHRC